MIYLFSIKDGDNVKIKELLELTQFEPLSKIAKERLVIGEKAAREALKAAGCYSISGKRGWYCDNQNILDKSIYDFALISKQKTKNDIERAKIEISATIEKPEAKEINDKESNQLENKTTMKKVTYEIEEDLHNQLKIKAIREKRKVSEIVNEILKNALSE